MPSPKKNKNPHVAKPLGRRPKSERKCITCRSPFMSEGPHHRMCDACRRASAGVPEKMLAIGSGCHVTQPRRRG